MYSELCLYNNKYIDKNNKLIIPTEFLFYIGHKNSLEILPNKIKLNIDWGGSRNKDTEKYYFITLYWRIRCENSKLIHEYYFIINNKEIYFENEYTNSEICFSGLEDYFDDSSGQEDFTVIIEDL